MTDAYYATLAHLGRYVHGSPVRRAIAAFVLAPVVAAALLWYWLTLPGVLGLVAALWVWRRRRAWMVRWARRLAARRSVHAAAALAVVAVGASRAHAGGYQPYWENNDPTVSENEASGADVDLVKWHAGIRVGPYVPDIDKQLGVSPGPYEQMFGGYRVLPMLDVDRILWTGFGQVGVGVSLGYMQKTARAFKMTADPNATDRPRASDENKFRLIPFALTATYRFTWLDDNYGIPIVPYVRGGLSYYLWWVNAPNGSLAEVCKDTSGTSASCGQNKALGGSLGVQGSIGLAIRAERVDPSTAISMRQSGIEHAGIYGELSLAKVDGFGSDTKLSVGDRTWFAGVDFEF